MSTYTVRGKDYLWEVVRDDGYTVYSGVTESEARKAAASMNGTRAALPEPASTGLDVERLADDLRDAGATFPVPRFGSDRDALIAFLRTALDAARQPEPDRLRKAAVAIDNAWNIQKNAYDLERFQYRGGVNDFIDKLRALRAALEATEGAAG